MLTLALITIGGTAGITGLTFLALKGVFDYLQR
jgi:hypothetical protein